MRILYASERPPYPFFLGGAARCAHMLLHGLANELDTPCAAVGASDYAVSSWSFPAAADHASLGIRSAQPGPTGGSLDCGYPVEVFPDFPAGLAAYMDRFRPDLVWAQLEGARSVLEIARRKGIQGLYFVHDAEFDPAELRAIADLGCHLVCSSGFLAEKARRATGRRAHVVYPPAELYFDTQGDPQGYVTMINPHKVKGLDTFLAIARRLPQVRFLLQESWQLGAPALAALEQQLASLPNVTFQRRVSDMRAVYRQTRLLLAPSVWEEGFGMVAVEAQSCRIPVLASPRGGLPESVGDGGILIPDYRNAEAWVAALQRVLADPAEYRALAERAHRHAASADFAPPQLARRFLAACAAPPPAMGLVARGLRAAVRKLDDTPVLGRLLRQATR